MDDMLTLVEPLIPTLRRYARGLLGDADAADDTVQDCLEKVVANWHRRRNENPRTWVFSILHNLAVNRIRQKARRGYLTPIEDMPEQNHSIAASQDETVYGRQVMQAIERLPPDYRSVILLVSVEDLSYADAAKVLDIPIGTVMSRLSRGREQLRALLEPQPVSAGTERPHLRSVK